MWHCPLCRLPLTSDDKTSLTCSAGHCYDIAREGYVNLLLANRKQSLEPGDSKEMISARGRIHDEGLYQPLATAIQEQVAALEIAPSQLLDLGCGEGYYSSALQRAFPVARVRGIDIAKAAVKRAAKKCPRASFAVASAFDVPLADSSLDLVASIFAPVNEGELSRVLAPGGIYLKVTPAPSHLWELRDLLYDQPEPHSVESQLAAGFESLTETGIEYSLQINGSTLRDLVAMTPYAHRGQARGRDKLGHIEEIDLQMSFDISVQRKL